MNELKAAKNFTTKDKLKFIIPSLFGLFCFLMPLPYKGATSIPMGVVADQIDKFVKPAAPLIIMCAVSLSAIMGIYTKLFRPKFILENRLLNKFFNDTPIYLAVKFIGMIFTIMVYYQTGPSIIISGDTGGTMIDLMSTPITWIFVAALLIPILTDFGIMDYVGTLVRDFIQPLFRLPGRSAVDLLASWVGNSNVGVVLTISQYEQGYYTGREAITIATCFSTVSLPYTLVVCRLMSIEQYFLPFYATLTISGLVAVVVMCRIPPLSTYPNTYYAAVGKQINEDIPQGVSLPKWAFIKAVGKAQQAGGPKELLTKSADTYFNILFNLVPVTMCFGILALIVVEHTSIFQYLAIPFRYYLQLLGVPEAAEAAPGMIVGFADMYLPIIIGSKLTSVKARFIVGIISLVQIIYMTEVGTMLMISKVPVGFKGLLAIFLEKTVIVLPVIVLCANLFHIG